MATSAATRRPVKAPGKPPGKGKARNGRLAWAGRIWAVLWVRVALLVALVTLGLPMAHALFGEVVALLGGAMLLGFLLGRWTARR